MAYHFILFATAMPRNKKACNAKYIALCIKTFNVSQKPPDRDGRRKLGTQKGFIL